MTDCKDIKEIKDLLSPQIEWYKKHKFKELNKEIDDSYIYDELCYEFSNINRGVCLALMEILAND